MMKWKVVLLVFLLALGFWPTKLVMAQVNCDGTSNRDECLAISKQIVETTKELQSLRQATAPLESEIKRLDASIKLIQSRINVAVAKQKQLEKEVTDREEKVAEHYVLFGKKIREIYKSIRGSSLLVQILSSVGSGKLNREIAYQGTASNVDKQLIVGLSEEILSLENDKKGLERQKLNLAILQKSLDEQADFFRKEVATSKKYQSELEGKIAALSALQQSILGEKQETFQTTVGDVPLADDPNSRPDYNPGFSPAFAAFSFGAPHFKGMSQYGAFGRAKAGQNEEQILKVYYGDVRIETVDTGGDIQTSSGTMSFEDRYLMGIAEMPSTWEDNNLAALKAQAIAARSYALAYTDWRMGSRSMKKSICTTESCQVWSVSKANSVPDSWRRAVTETRGKILVSNNSNEVINAWYASTSGGYQESYTSLSHSTPAFWDTRSGRGGWTSQAFEKEAGSPWFYKGWYKSRSGASCGRNHPWLTGEEMADILNAWVVLYQQGQSDSRVVPVDYVSCFNKPANPYSIAELKDKGSYSSVTGVNVTYSDGGYTANLTFSTNKGDVTIKGSEFKDAFNIRAPGRVALKSGLFNIEKK